MMNNHRGYVLKFSEPKELRYPQPNCMHKIGNWKKPSGIKPPRRNILKAQYQQGNQMKKQNLYPYDQNGHTRTLNHHQL